MTEFSKKARRPPRSPLPTFATRFQAAALRVSTAFLESSSFQHALTKGEEREKTIAKFFKQNLPTTFQVSGGSAIDANGTESPQLDAMIFDGSRSIPIYDGDAVILPAEAILVSIEVKSKVASEELRRSIRAAENLKSLLPFKREVIRGGRDGTSRADQCRFFHVLFAYESDLVDDTDLSKEHKRLKEAIEAEGAGADAVDRLYIAKKGLVNAADSYGIREHEGTANALMALSMDTLNFTLRENRNRKDVPYQQYSGTMGLDIERYK
ncbi:MAG: hypothetical protein P1U82_27245 [Verrucomicrobiales bacterium]|nr:hypothetical protein [Verrucomicrobiales bacterium]